MDNKRLKSIHGGYFDAEMLLAYRSGTLSEAERERIERAMENDPFLKDAIEGLHDADPVSVKKALASMEQDIDVITGKKRPFRISATVKKFSAAAAILVFFGLTVLIMNRLNNDAAKQQLAKNDETIVYPSLSNADTGDMGGGAIDDGNIQATPTAVEAKEVPAKPVAGNSAIAEKDIVTYDMNGATAEDVATEAIKISADDVGYFSVDANEIMAEYQNNTLSAPAVMGSAADFDGYNETNQVVLAEKTSAKEKSLSKKSEDKSSRDDKKNNRLYSDEASGAAPESIISADSTPVYADPQTLPEFVGGNTALYIYLGNTISLIQADITGTVYVSFMVQTDGSITDAKILKGIHPELDANVLEAIKNMPNWIPGKINGIPTATRMTIPVKFNL